LAVRTKI